MTDRGMIQKGLRFGMALQLAVGPLCFLTLRTATERGFLAGVSVAVAVTLADALFVALSCLGAVTLLKRARVRAAVTWVGSLVLCLFGLNIIVGAFGITLIPGLSLLGASDGNPFWQGFVLTVSNPLTILFWGGVFTAQITQNQWTRRQLWWFATGCVLSTLLSLSLIAGIGTAVSGFLPEIAIQILNVLVGAALIVYGVRLLYKKDQAVSA
ncbi:MAG TPA: LysE family transporter [Candidatus Limiplasma sp.]|nr:LysE family transporter [Candidatus Limiplasma sp.]HRX09705.1 LysE family transporter [Candidatus Limiplasma sp.]